MTTSIKTRGAIAGVLSLGLVAGGATAFTASASAAEPAEAAIYLWTGDQDVPALAETTGAYDRADQLVISASATDVNAEIKPADFVPAGQTASKVYRFVAPAGKTAKADWTAWEITEAAGLSGGVLNDNFTLEDHSRGSLATAFSAGGDYWVGLAFADAADNVLGEVHRVLHIQQSTGKFTIDPAADGGDPGDPNPAITVTGATPAVSGTAQVGKKLTVKAGSWGPKGVKLSYQWLRSGKAIKGATKTSYTLVAADRGKKISVRVTGSASGATAVAKVSKTSSAVKYGKLTAKTPKVSGTAKVKKTLKAKAGSWGPKGVKLSYQWLRNGKAIKGATKSSYKLVTADKKKKISVKVTGKLSGYSTVAKKSSSKKIK